MQKALNHKSANMDISVIVPIYKVEAYIEDCLRSVADQTCLGKGVQVECILVDDCGNDRSMELCEQYIKAYKGQVKFRILHHEHNRGLSAARNTGMEVAEGEYVIFLDSDDKFTSDCLEKLYAKARETDADVTFGSYETFGCEHKKRITNGIPFVTAWNKLCKRSFLQDNKIQFVEGLVHEDCPWTFEINCRNAHFAHVPDVTYLYLVREGSLQTGKDYSKHYEAYMWILRLYADIIANTGQPEKYVHWFECQKSLYFGMTLKDGTPEQCLGMYALIRTLSPKLHDNKADWHYWIPQGLGYRWYKRFFNYHLC